MPLLHFKGRVFVENFDLGAPFHVLKPVRARGLSRKASLHDNLIVEGDNLLALKALLPTCHGKVKCTPMKTGSLCVCSPSRLRWRVPSRSGDHAPTCPHSFEESLNSSSSVQ